ncbi:hypothetical protein J2X11_000112 [Aeromicrobium panaciterrae]|uniref:Uncharacterized protein n=1 Tax=Aeromicrobium panaciterrae TaxID=363861 RepID=A0ABU1UJD4_9ACTN|nr:hypothetical protein [Aeromicrobium panaciterrae]MDR7085273.1 hypothetical protein [Aeromicrobium panaciterrae]
MRKLLAVAASLLVLTACGGSDGSSGDSDSPTIKTSEPTGGDSDAGTGVPDIVFPPGAEVEEMAPGITQYTVRNSTVDLAKLYWENYFKAIGFTKYNEASASVFYEKGSLKMQATYAQFDADVRGTVKVLSQ